MQIETGHFVIAVLAGVGIGILLFWRQRLTMSIPKIVFSMIGTAFAVYYILYVVLGSGRTGWP